MGLHSQWYLGSQMTPAPLRRPPEFAAQSTQPNYVRKPQLRGLTPTLLGMMGVTVPPSPACADGQLTRYMGVDGRQEAPDN